MCGYSVHLHHDIADIQLRTRAFPSDFRLWNSADSICPDEVTAAGRAEVAL